MRHFSAALLLALAACGAPAPAPDGGATDLSSASDQSVNPDLGTGPTQGIPCAAASCITMGQICCTSDYGKTGLCQSAGNPTCQGGFPYYCDGPEDCAPAEPVCCQTANGALCAATGQCESMAIGFVMCHKPTDCPGTGQNCCPAPNGGLYKLCSSAACK